MFTPDSPEKILHIKEVGWRYATVKRDELECPKPLISYQVASSFAAIHIEWGKEAIAEYEPSTTSGTWHQIWLQQGTEMREVIPCWKQLCLILEENKWQQLWEGLETKWLLVCIGWNKRDLEWLCQLHFPHNVNSPRMHVDLEDPWPRRLFPLI